MTDLKWKPMRLRVDQVRQDQRFQGRVGGIDQANLRAIIRAVEGDRSIEPIKVAQIGKAYYVVEGFHRLKAYEHVKVGAVEALVARMSLGEAEVFCLSVNSAHGKQLTRKDKAAALTRYVELGRHLGPLNVPKSSRAIAAELGHIYSHETVRQKLKALGHEIPKDVDFPEGYKSWGGGDDDDEWDEELERERVTEAQGHIEAISPIFFSLNDAHKRELLAAVRKLVETLELNVAPAVPVDFRDILDI